MDEQSKESLAAEIKNAEDVIKKLETFTKELKNTDNNILTHLCTGLEKFLGFNPSSKGYDGQGIVYSDLDRLCDGVMGFLSGVLGAVKNTQTYNVGKNTLQKLVSNEINNHLCSGHDGFKKLLPRLTREVGRYNTEVRDSNEKVKKPIEELLNQVGDAFRNKVNDLLSGPNDHDDPDKVQTAEKQIKNTFRDEITTFKNTFNSAYNFTTKIEKSEMKIAINYLNSSLQLRVKHGVSNVAHEIQRLEQVADKEQKTFEAAEKKVKEVMKTLKNGVDEKIANHVNRLVERLKGKVQEILDGLKSINASLVNCINQMQDWIDKAQLAIDAALEKVDFIFKEVDENSLTRHPKQLKDAAESITFAATVLFNNGIDARQQVAKLVPEAEAKLKLLEDAVKDGLNEVKLHLQIGIDKYVREYLGDVQRQVKGIMHPNTGLERIRRQVKEWALTFSGSNEFGERIKEWVKHIVNDNNFISSKLLTYVTGNGQLKSPYNVHSSSPINENLSTVIAEQIVHKIQSDVIQDAGKAVEELIGGAKSATNKNIDEYAKAVMSGCDSFADGLEGQLSNYKGSTATGITALSGDIAGMIETIVAPTGRSGKVANLRMAVSNILLQLVGMARQQVADLEWLISDDEKKGNIKKVNSALSVAGTLNENFRKALLKKSDDDPDYDSTQPFDSGALDLNANIEKTIHGELEKRLPQESGTHGRGSTKVELHPTHFSVYLGFGDRTGNKQDLDTALRKIQTDITNTFEGIETFNIQAAQQFDQVSHHLTALCKAVRDHGENAKFHLDTFKSHNIKDTLTKLKENLGELQGKLLHGPIKDAENFVRNGATAAERLCVNELKQDVAKDVDNAKKALSLHNRTQYILSIKEAFTSFADRVKREFQSLLEPIDKDLMIGMKGFMTKMESHFVKYKNRLEEITKISKTSPPGTLSPVSRAAYMFSDAYRTFVREVKTQTDFTSDFRKIKPSHDALTKLLDGLNASKHFNYKFEENLHELKNTFKSFNPSTFGESTTALSQCLKEGIRALLTELDKTYVNKYSGRVLDWTDATEQRNCAKLLFTIIFTLQEDVDRLRKECITGGRWSDKRLYENEKREVNPLGKFLKRCGFQVAEDANSKTGELRYPSYHFTGKSVYGKLTEQGVAEPALIEHLSKCEWNESKKPNHFNLFDLLSCLLHHVEKYSEVCHIPIRRKPRQPCNVYEMLVWCSGLTYNTVYQTMLDVTLTDLFVDPKKANAGDGPSATDISGASIEAYPANITYDALRQAVVDTCSVSYDLLCKLVGHGDAFATYGIDFCTNTANLYYPSSGDDCLQMLLEVTRRVFPPLTYLLQKCSLNAQCSGWRECQYGRDIMSSRQPCKEHANEGSLCRPTSPLMSYLSDTLPGHLPHHVTSTGCKSVCSNCPKGLPGMPCITPLGFRGYSGSTRTGKELCEVLTKLLDNKLTSSLSCLFPKPPSNLPEHFSFALSLANGWHCGLSNSKTHVIQDAFAASITKATINLHDRRSDLTDALRNAYGSRQDVHDNRNHNPTSADLRSLSMQQSCPNHQCGPYLQSLSGDAYSLLAPKHAGLYLSWATYLPWTFHNYLKSLLTEYQQIFCRDWGCRRCQRGDGCRPGNHGSFDNPCQCKSLVSCKGVSATLYKCGFALGNAAALNEKTNARTCTKFGVLLKRVIDSKYFVALFKQCDELLFKIRAPFIWLNVALWLLSLLYLLHIMVIRLDLLHIKSHLHSPSSHRIAAQSLLSAARVKALNKVLYLQP